MAYASGYKYDVFISFALVDDSCAPGEVGWVSRFTTDFCNALKTRLGGTPELEIFYSQQRAQGGNYSIEEFSRDASDSALMVSVVSRSYVGDRAGKKPVSLLELEAFLGISSADRLFLAQIQPFLDGEPCPDVLRSKIAVRFWYETSAGAPIALEPTTAERREQYKDRVGDLAEAVSTQLRAMRLGNTRKPAFEAPTLGTVVLAQVTDELEEARDQVRRHLQQYGVRVLPEGHGYSADPEEFRSAFAADVGAADMVVQLLGRFAGRRPENYVQLQARIATDADKPIAQWRHPELSVDDLPDAQRALLESSTVFVGGLEVFKLDVVAKLRALLSPKPKSAKAEQEEALPGSALVFINADVPDMTIARAVGQTITKEGHALSFPIFDGSTQDLREDLENNIVGCDALVLVYGETQVKWVRAQLLHYNKVKRKRQLPVRVLAVYTGEEEKPPIEMVMPEMVQINAARLPHALAMLKH